MPVHKKRTPSKSSKRLQNVSTNSNFTNTDVPTQSAKNNVKTNATRQAWRNASGAIVNATSTSLLSKVKFENSTVSNSLKSLGNSVRRGNATQAKRNAVGAVGSILSSKVNQYTGVNSKSAVNAWRIGNVDKAKTEVKSAVLQRLGNVISDKAKLNSSNVSNVIKGINNKDKQEVARAAAQILIKKMTNELK